MQTDIPSDVGGLHAPCNIQGHQQCHWQEVSEYKHPLEELDEVHDLRKDLNHLVVELLESSCAVQLQINRLLRPKVLKLHLVVSQDCSNADLDKEEVKEQVIHELLHSRHFHLGFENLALVHVDLGLPS